MKVPSQAYIDQFGHYQRQKCPVTEHPADRCGKMQNFKSNSNKIKGSQSKRETCCEQIIYVCICVQ